MLLKVAADALLPLQVPSPWAGWRPATCMPDACFCEAVGSGLVRQPVAAATSLAFVAVAAAVLWRRSTGVGGAEGPLDRRLYALALVVVGLGSAFFHASLTFVGQTADVLGMYLIATFVLLHGAARVWPLARAGAGKLYLAGNAVLLTLLVAWPGLRRWAFAAVVLGALYCEVRAARTASRPRGFAAIPPFAAAVALLAAGFLIWTLDLTRVLCSPTSLVQGHGVWHLCGAAAAWLVSLHFAAEDGTAIPVGDGPTVRPAGSAPE